MPDIIAVTSGNDDDATLYNSSLSSWSDARGSTSDPSGTFRNDGGATINLAVFNRQLSGRGGVVFRCFRSYFAFDLSGESGTASAVTLNIRGQWTGTTDTK